VRVRPWLGRFNYLGFALTDLIISQCTNISVELKEMLPLLYVLFSEILHHEAGKPNQEPIIRRVQLSHIPITAFSQTDLFLFWIYRVFRPLQEPQWPNTSTDLIFNWRRHFHREIKRKKSHFSPYRYMRSWSRTELTYFVGKEGLSTVVALPWWWAPGKTSLALLFHDCFMTIMTITLWLF